MAFSRLWMLPTLSRARAFGDVGRNGFRRRRQYAECCAARTIGKNAASPPRYPRIVDSAFDARMYSRTWSNEGDGTTSAPIPLSGPIISVSGIMPPPRNLSKAYGCRGKGQSASILEATGFAHGGLPRKAMQTGGTGRLLTACIEGLWIESYKV